VSNLDGWLKRPGLSVETVSQVLAARRQRRVQFEADNSIPAVRNRCAQSLYQFIQDAWHVLEPSTPFVPGWHVRAIADHLQAITEEQCPQPPRLLINVPPGSQKSLTVTFWNAWEWGPRGLTGMRYLTTSFTEDAVKRDCRRVRALCNSDWYRSHWPEVELIREGELSIENSRTGSRDGVAFGSLVSRRGDRLVIDDPHSVEKAESEIDRRRAVARFREGAVNRLNDQQRSAIVVIMQRLHEGDISGEIQTTGMGYEQLILPMEYESSRHCQTEIGFSDPRSKDGELLCPARFPKPAVDDLKRDMGPYAWAGQYQQRPAPRGGGILPYNAWEYWSKSEALKYGRNESQFPDFETIIASLDTAFTEKKENDLSALVILGVWQNLYGQLQVMLMHCWQARLKFSDLVERVVKSCRKMRVVRLLIEGGANGISVQQEIQRLTRGEEFALHLITPNKEGDKEARANAVSHFFAERSPEGALIRKGLVWVPAVEQANGDACPRAWAEECMGQAASFPRGKHDDLVDALVQGLRFLRQRGMVRQPREHEVDEVYKLMAPPVRQPPLYPT
jgi:phage terminase large subunit-like protein